MEHRSRNNPMLQDHVLYLNRDDDEHYYQCFYFFLIVDINDDRHTNFHTALRIDTAQLIADHSGFPSLEVLLLTSLL
jgi:hypothetical protein